jgi:hypothetical protein
MTHARLHTLTSTMDGCDWMGQPHAPSHFTLGKKPPVPNEQENSWVPELAWKSLTPWSSNTWPDVSPGTKLFTCASNKHMFHEK